MGLGIGIDFGTTNSVVAIAGPNGHVESLVFPTPLGPTPVFRTALTFWAEGRTLRHVAGPGAVARAVEGHDNQRFVQSIKTHVASALFASTRMFGTTLTIERLVSTFLDHLLAPHRAAMGGSARASSPAVPWCSRASGPTRRWRSRACARPTGRPACPT